TLARTTTGGEPMKTRIALMTFALAAACGSDDDTGSNPAPFDPDNPYEPAVTAGELSPDITHPFFPWPPGATWTYEMPTDEGLEHTEMSVESETRDVNGATARVVRDTVYLDGEMIEDTRDWY